MESLRSKDPCFYLGKLLRRLEVGRSEIPDEQNSYFHLGPLLPRSEEGRSEIPEEQKDLLLPGDIFIQITSTST